jgi:hypothetical protein
VAGVGQGDPADVREGPLQGVDGPAGAEVVGAVDEQDRDLEGLPGAEQLVVEGAAVGVEGAVALGVGAQERGRLALGVLQGPVAVGEVGESRRVASSAPQEWPSRAVLARPWWRRTASRSVREGATVYGPRRSERPQPRWSQRCTVTVSPSRPARPPKVSQKPGPPWQRISGSPLPDRVVHSRQPSSVTAISSIRRF